MAHFFQRLKLKTWNSSLGKDMLIIKAQLTITTIFKTLCSQNYKLAFQICLYASTCFVDKQTIQGLPLELNIACHPEYYPMTKSQFLGVLSFKQNSTLWYTLLIVLESVTTFTYNDTFFDFTGLTPQYSESVYLHVLLWFLPNAEFWSNTNAPITFPI